MPDLNSVILSDLTAAGIDRAAAVQLTLWRPYRCWADLDRIEELGAEQIARLRDRGFTLDPIGDDAWPIPPAFRLTAKVA